MSDYFLLNNACQFLKAQVEQTLHKRIEEDGHAIFILPGGRSIQPFFPFFISMDVPWDKVTVSLCDERCVPTDHEQSNEKQLKEMFLNHLGHFHFVSLCDELIVMIQKYNPITVLGLGEDGHVASLFPNEYESWKYLDVCLFETAIQNPTRISLSEKALLLSSKIFLLVMGVEKIMMYEKSNPSQYYLSNIYKTSSVLKVNLG